MTSSASKEEKNSTLYCLYVKNGGKMFYVLQLIEINEKDF